MESPEPQGLSQIMFEESLDTNLRQVAELAVRNVTGADFAGITLMREGRPTTAAFTDPASPEIDAAQYESGEGPCLDAFRQNTVFYVRDTRTDTRWLSFAEAAADHGVLSTLSLPHTAGPGAIGALNMYSQTAEGFVNQDEATMFGVQAAIVLSNAQAFWATQQLAADLERALQSRAVIEQAKGIIIGARRCSPDAAFDVLVQQSQFENRKVREIAKEIVRDAATNGSQDPRDGPADSER
jgi:putative methionine-R-sulfoxide reductase with GAF domain